jgi:myo-inositol-1(or 4)-monophosphatase
MNDLLEFAVDLAFEAGRIQKRRYRERHSIFHKGEINIVTDVDLACQERMMSLIARRFPNDRVISEEKDNIFDGGGNRWIIDPIDGTTNYAHGYPFFCSSVAYEAGGKVVCGAVYNPIFDELFFAEAGKGSYLNGRRLTVSRTGELKQSLLVTGFPYDINTSNVNNIDHFVSFLYRAQAVRRDGSAALNLSYVAAGRFEGFWELKLNSWDMAAGMLILTEAGGVVTDLAGGPFSIYGGQIVASNGLVHQEMLKVLKGDMPARLEAE